jgi:hypothetical protein
MTEPYNNINNKVKIKLSDHKTLEWAYRILVFTDIFGAAARDMVVNALRGGNANSM